MDTAKYRDFIEYSDFIDYGKGVASMIDGYFKNAVPADQGSGLKSRIEYAIFSGKKIRPLLTVLSYQCLGGKIEDIIPLAASVELLHNSTLVHDDIIDKDAIRRPSEPLYKKFGTSDAIIAGDAMIALSVNISSQYGAEIVREMSRSGYEICNGEFLDISLTLDATEEMIMLKMSQKSASLFKCATMAGAMAIKGTTWQIDAFSRFGEHFGMAYQIKDDMMDILRSEIPDDFRNACMTLPLLHLYNNCDESMKNFIKENLGKNIGKESSEKIVNAMQDAGSIDHSESLMKQRVKMAKDAIKDIDDSVYKQYLLDMPDMFLH